MAGVVHTLKNVCERSSLKALPHIIRAQTRFQRILWIFAFLLGFAIGLYQLIKLCSKYRECATSVNMVETQGAPPFPDVTVCRLDLEWAARVLEQNFGPDLSLGKYRQRLVKLGGHLLDSHDEKEYHAFQKLSILQGYIHNVPLTKHEIDVLRDNFIIECDMGAGQPSETFKCQSSRSNASGFFHPNFGFCVTMHVINATKFKTLNLIVYLDKEEADVPQYYIRYMDTWSHTGSVGEAVVVIHPRGSNPDIYMQSEHISVGKDVAFVINGERHTVLDEPSDSCIPSEELHKGSTSYGMECIHKCHEEFVLSECGCLDVDNVYSQEYVGLHEPCARLNEEDFNRTIQNIWCAHQAKEKLQEYNKGECKCGKVCDSFIYKYSTRTKVWPKKTHHLSFYEQFIRQRAFSFKFDVYEDLLNLSKINATYAQQLVAQESLIQDNFAHIRIVNMQQRYLHLSEQLLMSPEVLFGNIGGLLNLWMGMTFVVLIEISDFVYQCCLNKYRGRRVREKENDLTVPDV